MNMLANQNQVLQSHTEILNNNQKHIAEMMKITKETLSRGGPPSGAAVSQDGRQMIRELLLPINQQLMEVRNLYMEAKELASEANRKAMEIKQAKQQAPGDGEAMADALSRYIVSTSPLPVVSW
jgi:hypothetical protein